MSFTEWVTVNELDLDKWSDIVAIASGHNHMIGLKADGSVIAAGCNDDGTATVNGQIDLSKFRNIVAIYAGNYFTVLRDENNTVFIKGLTKNNTVKDKNKAEIVEISIFSSEDNNEVLILDSNGNVSSYGDNTDGQGDVANWQQVNDIFVTEEYSVAVKEDGNVITAGKIAFGEIASWQNIQQIACSDNHVVGLKKDGTVIAIGDNTNGQCNVQNWNSIKSVYAFSDFTLGVKEDGSVIVTEISDTKIDNIGYIEYSEQAF